MVRKLSGSLPFCSPAPHRQNRVNLLVILLQGRHVFPRLLRTVPLSIRVVIFITSGLVQVEIMAITLYHQPLEERGR